MKNYIKSTVLVLAASISMSSTSALSQGLAKDPLTMQECSDCHIPYSPRYLPARSWVAIMDSLDNHFGENASLGPDVTAEIKQYLETNAGDTGDWISPKLRRLDPNETPMRISELSWFRREHGRKADYTKFISEYPDVSAIADCKGCHK